MKKELLKRQTKIITVSEGCKELLSKKVRNSACKFEVIPNGYDPEDFSERLKESDSHEFIITYTGTMSEQYSPEPVFNVIKSLQKSYPIKLQLIGKLSKVIHDSLQANEVDYEYMPPVPHEEINKYQMKADLLLLLIPESKNNKGIVTGKIFRIFGIIKSYSLHRSKGWRRSWNYC